MNIESLKHPYKDSSETIEKFLDVDLSVNSLEMVSKDSVCDYEEFYENYELKEVSSAILAISYDGKGIPMTSKESEKIKGREDNVESKKVRLGKGEKKQKKKEALAGVCYETEAKYRTAEDISNNLVFGKTEVKEDKSPKGKNVRRMASIEKPKREIVEEIRKEAERRDPEHKSIWAIIMDGAPYLWLLVYAVFKGTNFIPILDIIHVIEYLWDAGNALFGDKSSERQFWVHEKLVKILQGKVSKVIKELKDEARKKSIKGANLKQVERSVKYFENHKKWMKYDQYLEKGLPIASGVVESTCGHLIKDRMELSGCKWNIQGAENILKLRSIKTSDNWDEYWKYHIAQQKILLYDCKQVS